MLFSQMPYSKEEEAYNAVMQQGIAYFWGSGWGFVSLCPWAILVLCPLSLFNFSFVSLVPQNPKNPELSVPLLFWFCVPPGP